MDSGQGLRNPPSDPSLHAAPWDWARLLLRNATQTAAAARYNKCCGPDPCKPQAKTLWICVAFAAIMATLCARANEANGNVNVAQGAARWCSCMPGPRSLPFTQRLSSMLGVPVCAHTRRYQMEAAAFPA